MHLLEMLYYAGFAAKRFFSLKNRKRLPFRVISIGNLTAGGTGKTPAAISLAAEAARRGYRPVILTRGYRGSAKGPCFVTKGGGPLLTAAEAGDEPFLMAEKTEEVPIVKGGDRYESGIFALRELQGRAEGVAADASAPFLFLLDDGFQHFGLYRDRDIVLIDATNPFGNGLLFPLGRLREPVGALGRADIVVLTKLEKTPEQKGPNPQELVGRIRKINPDAPVFFARHVPAYLEVASGERRPLGLVEGKRLFGFCALGSPDSFKATVQSLGAELAGFKTFRDHYRYRQSDIDSIRAAAEKGGAEWIVTTEKDIIKIRNLDLPENILIIGVDFSVEDEFYEEVFRT